MEQFHRSSQGSRSDPSPEWGETGLEEPMWQLGLGGGGGGGGEESYPQRPDEADCTYYLRTGFCGFGERCRFNHPRDRAAVIGAARITGGYPERLGQPVCQYYMRTRSCKFGASCKYDHPRQSGGGSTISPVSLNYHGYPLRPGEKECSYYAKTGQCKFGATCKFDHPPSAGVQIPAPSPVPPLSPLPVPVPVPSPLYPTAQPPAGHSSQQIGVLVARPPLLPGSFVQSAYGPVVMSPTMVPISGWGPYQSPATSPLLPSSTPSNVGSAQLYGITQLPAYTGPYQPSGSSVGPSSGIRKEQTFPERPNQAEYQYYSKTGEFTIGSSYGYHQSPDMNAPQVNVLSPAGLPLRPGAPPCTHYAQRGACKFGPACRFDHSMVPISQSPSASSLADVPVAPYPVGSSVGMLAPSSSSSSSSSSEMQPELTTGSSKESIPTQISSSVSTSTGSVGSTLFTGVPVSQSSTTQSSSPLAAANTTTSSDVSNTSS